MKKLTRKQQEINMSKAYQKSVYQYIDALGFNYLKDSGYVPKREVENNE
jgi:hypothetical protein